MGGWSAVHNDKGAILLKAEAEGNSISLQLEPSKALVYHGHKGYSRRDDDPGIASFHCSYTRMATKGSIVLDGECMKVDGLSWMDHEKMLVERKRLIHGWDWYAMQLDDGSELMLYLLKNKDGSYDEKYSYGTAINAKGKSSHLAFQQMEIRILRHWTSELTGGKYPSRTEIKIPSLSLKIEVNALVKESELNCIRSSYVAYWEGPIAVSGTQGKKKISGQGYLELCGYDRRKSAKLVHFMILPESHSA
jgi:predicted secreted hydrolase